jgi:hypothetical protein
MPAQLQPGNASPARQVQATSVAWYPLPKWLAGRFQSNFITNQVVQVYSQAAPPHRSSGHMKHVDSFGMQQDKTGRVWHADILPRIGLWEGAQEEIQTTVAKQCVETSDNKVVLHIHNHCVFLDGSKQRIVYAEQVDGYKTITQKNDNGDLSIYDDVQEYDCYGRPLDRYIATSVMKRIEDFTPRDSENGVDLRASLAQYLASIGRSDLIPAAGQMPPSGPTSDPAQTTAN